MNFIHVSIYAVLCIVLFIITFMGNEIFYFLFEKKMNNITDYNHSEFTGGMTYEFNPCLKK